MEPERIVMLRIEKLHHQKSMCQEIQSTVFHYAPMMRCHQQQKPEPIRTKIWNKRICWVARLDWLPLPRLPSPRLRILARIGTYVLPTQACANKSVMTMNGFGSNAFLFNFCLKKYRKCQNTLEPRVGQNSLTMLYQSWQVTQITTKSFFWKLCCVVFWVSHWDCNIIETYPEHTMPANYWRQKLYRTYPAS